VLSYLLPVDLWRWVAGHLAVESGRLSLGHYAVSHQAAELWRRLALLLFLTFCTHQTHTTHYALLHLLSQNINHIMRCSQNTHHTLRSVTFAFSKHIGHITLCYICFLKTHRPHYTLLHLLSQNT
jgi:hypothetical protein